MTAQKNTPAPADSNPQATVIGPSCRITGDVALDGDAVILGAIDGGLDVAGALEIGEEGRVAGGVHCGSLRVLGEVRGDVACHGPVTIVGAVEGDVRCAQTAEIKPGAALVGDLHANSINIAEGAAYRGHVTIGPDPLADATTTVGTIKQTRPAAFAEPTDVDTPTPADVEHAVAEIRGETNGADPETLKMDERSAVASLIRRRATTRTEQSA